MYLSYEERCLCLFLCLSSIDWFGNYLFGLHLLHKYIFFLFEVLSPLIILVIFKRKLILLLHFKYIKVKLK